MAKIEYFLVAESCSVDQRTNRVSVFNVLERVQISNPAQLSNLVVVAVFNKADSEDEEKHIQQVIIHRPNGEELKGPEVEFKFTAPVHRAFLNIENLPIEEEGQVVFELLLDGEHAAQHILYVREIEDETEVVRGVEATDE